MHNISEQKEIKFSRMVQFLFSKQKFDTRFNKLTRSIKQSLCIFPNFWCSKTDDQLFSPVKTEHWTKLFMVEEKKFVKSSMFCKLSKIAKTKDINETSCVIQ